MSKHDRESPNSKKRVPKNRPDANTTPSGAPGTRHAENVADMPDGTAVHRLGPESPERQTLAALPGRGALPIVAIGASAGRNRLLSRRSWSMHAE